MKKITRQTFTFSIVFAMVFSLFFSLEGFTIKSNALSCPMLTYNTEGAFYEIWDADDLEAMSCRVNATYSQTTSDPMLVDNEAAYKLMANVDMGDVEHWVPIGTSFSPFSGSFNGNGFTISNLTITQTTTYFETYNNWFEMHSAGLFGSVVSGNIENVKLDNFSINIEPIMMSAILDNDDRMIFAGVLAAALENTRVDQVEIKNSEIVFIDFSEGLNETVIKVGGMSGYSNHSLITKSHVAADIYLDDNATNEGNYVFFTYVGGFIGNAHDTQVVQSKYQGDITVNVVTYLEAFVGGLIGRTDFDRRNDIKAAAMFQIERSFNQNEVVANIDYDGKDYYTYYVNVGGMFGLLYNGAVVSANVSNTTIDAKINSWDSYLGGLVGRGFDTNVTFSRFKGDIFVSESYNTTVGGLLGGLSGQSSINQSYAIGDMDIASYYYEVGGLIGSTQQIGLIPVSLAGIDESSDVTISDVYSRMGITVTNFEPIMDASIQRDGPRYIGGLFGIVSGETIALQYGYYAGSIDLNLVEDIKSTQMLLFIDALLNVRDSVLRNEFTPFNDLYFDEDLLDESIGSLYGEPKSTLEMKTQSTFTNFDFEDIWVRSDAYNDGYPTFRLGRFLVQFVPNNDTVIPDQLTLKAVAPTDPVKENYTFVGWRLPSATENYVFNVLLDQDIVLTAHYLSNLKVLVEGTAALDPTAKGLETAVTYTEQERSESILTKLVITLLEEVDEDEEALVNAYLDALDKKYGNVLFLDISLYKVVGDVQTKITKANNMIEISFVLPEAYRNAPFVFLHIKDGKVEAIDFDYDETTFVLTFETDDFSSFVLASEQTPTDDIPDTSDSSQSYAWWLMLLGAMLVLLTSKKQQSNLR
jgi:uncharacterized repeat protein (TIGR02543 family)